MISNNPEIEQSYSNSQTLKRFLTPSRAQVFLYIVASLMILILFNAKQLWMDLSHSILLPQHGLHDLVIPGSTVDNVWQSIANSRVPLIIFWAIIGSIIYTFIWFIKSILTNLQNDMIADLYTHPSTYSRSGFWTKVIGHKILFILTIGVAILYAYACLVIVPLISQQAYYSVKYYKSLIDILQFVVIIAGLILMLHIFMLLAHMIMNMWRIIYKDL